MCSFSERLKGVVLPFDTFGNHLSADKKSVADIDLAKKNFAEAARLLKGFWSKDNYADKPVHVQYVEPTGNDPVNTRSEYLNDAVEGFNDSESLDDEQAKWLFEHAKFAKYSIDFRKCNDKTCCKNPVRNSALAKSLQPYNGFIPAIVSDQMEGFCRLGQVLAHPPKDVTPFLKTDMCLPSYQGLEKYLENVCKTCGDYFPVKKTLALHRRIGTVWLTVVHRKRRNETAAQDDSVLFVTSPIGMRRSRRSANVDLDYYESE
jgi:hypothetical protein